MGRGPEAPLLDFREVDQSRWADFAELFERPGGPKACWCMLWRAHGAETKQTRGAERRGAMERRVREGVPTGILGYLGAEPVAWCSIAPRDTYRRLGGVEDPGERAGDVWSLVCFFIRRDLRGQGVAPQVLTAAVAHARSRGAKVVEAYPVAPDAPSYRFMGFVPLFDAAGFHHFGLAGTRRNIMRLDCF